MRFDLALYGLALDHAVFDLDVLDADRVGWLGERLVHDRARRGSELGELLPALRRFGGDAVVGGERVGAYRPLQSRIGDRRTRIGPRACSRALIAALDELVVGDASLRAVVGHRALR